MRTWCVNTCYNLSTPFTGDSSHFPHTQDLESKSLVDEIHIDHLSATGPVDCMSLAWSSDGQTLFAGYTDALIRVYDVDTM